ncbi:MAG: Lrp/AsnC family transcriptional regulator [Bradyrhizobium sp.]|nr:Lrp/AsnC family transcriptional regulator [Bradyrhizobium sp.]
MSKPQLDNLDREIIDRLATDARISNRALAEVLGVTEGTIRARLKRLSAARLIRFTALTNLSRLGTMRVAFIRVHADLRRLRSVAEQIAQIEDIKCVIITTGRHNVLAMGPFSDFDTGVEDVTTRIGKIDGVIGLETSITIQAIKYNVRTAKILSAQSNAVEDDEPEEES